MAEMACMADDTAPSLVGTDLTLAYGPVVAVQSVSLSLHAGEVLAVVGRNGAGKSSLLSLLQGARLPDRGAVTLFGHPAHSTAARSQVGTVLQEIGFPATLTPREVLAFAAAHFPGSEPVGDMIEAFQLTALADRRIGGFSQGQRRRVALALAFVGNPRMVFLDEPTAGLDTEGQDLIGAQVQRFRDRGGSVVLTSHVWQDIETLADRIIVLRSGTVAFEGRASEIRLRLARRRVGLSLAGTQEPPDWFAREFAFENGRWLAESADSDGLVRRVCAAGLPFENLSVTPVDLRQTIDALAETGDPWR